MEKKKILIVDDEPEFVELMKVRLGASDYAVQALSDAREVSEAAASIKPDLILLDIVMPGIDGYEVCRLLEKDRKTAAIPVILLTGKDIDPQATYKKCRELGIAGFVSKPVNSTELLAKIKSAIK
jgi:two-component system alkaline phosphatase synthesis response regulator PhoP